MAKLNYLVIHCTDTPAGREVSGAEIRQWHCSAPPKGNGWRQVGYSDLIHLDGRIERLVMNNDDDIVDAWEVTNGVAGRNAECRHICYVGGGGGVDTRTSQQRNALFTFVTTLLRKFPNVKVVGHRDLALGKACPSFDVQRWLKESRIVVKEEK